MFEYLNLNFNFIAATIHNVMTVDRIVNKINTIINAKNSDIEEQKFTGLLYAFVTDLDLDGLSRVTINKW